jgi:hypothetical protein
MVIKRMCWTCPQRTTVLVELWYIRIAPGENPEVALPPRRRIPAENEPVIMPTAAKAMVPKHQELERADPLRAEHPLGKVVELGLQSWPEHTGGGGLDTAP